ncbi:hypothetical protein VTK73DRAFT_6738 [Phialemonium thermophilum]|uniref:Urease accessory protein UreF n=1 Tax=Phialemonium thermophilum TaxID=223376 RepID=A0ABR3WHY6_9PEZI
MTSGPAGPVEEEESSQTQNDIAGEIEQLERQLAIARQKLRDLPPGSDAQRPPPSGAATTSTGPAQRLQEQETRPAAPLINAPAHFLFLLSDSALPLGSFAFSSGLESHLAHHRAGLHGPFSSSSPPFATGFLPLSVSSYASTTLPFVLAAHRAPPSPQTLASLDDALDASIVCAVGRRASIAQGRALLGIWERSFAAEVGALSNPKTPVAADEAAPEWTAAGALKAFGGLLRTATGGAGSSTSSSTTTTPATAPAGPGASSLPPDAFAHLAPLFGAVCKAVGLSTQQTAYVFMLGHVKALVSAAVRAGLFGPYQAQKMLASGRVQSLLAAVIEREWETPVEMAGQCVPVMDLWIGRHEMLYSRIFNS